MAASQDDCPALSSADRRFSKLAQHLLGDVCALYDDRHDAKRIPELYLQLRALQVIEHLRLVPSVETKLYRHSPPRPRRDRRRRARPQGDGCRAPVPRPRRDPAPARDHGGRARVPAKHEQALRRDRDRHVPAAVHPVPGDDAGVLRPRSLAPDAGRGSRAQRRALPRRPRPPERDRRHRAQRARAGVDLGRASLQHAAVRVRVSRDARPARAARRLCSCARTLARAAVPPRGRSRRIPRHHPHRRPRSRWSGSPTGRSSRTSRGAAACRTTTCRPSRSWYKAACPSSR